MTVLVFLWILGAILFLRGVAHEHRHRCRKYKDRDDDDNEHHKKHRAKKLNLRPSVPFEEGDMSLTLVMNANQQDVVRADPTDAKGRPVRDPLSWSLSDSSIASIAVAEDGMSCTFVATQPGMCSVTCSNGNLSDFVDVTITSAPAVALNLSADIPSDQP